MILEERQIQLLCELAYRVKQASDCSDVDLEGLRTASDLARDLGLKHEFIKKQLKLLKDYGLILPVGLNPKKYRFDSYQYRIFLSENPDDDTLQALIIRLRLMDELDPVPISRDTFSRYRHRK